MNWLFTLYNKFWVCQWIANLFYYLTDWKLKVEVWQWWYDWIYVNHA